MNVLIDPVADMLILIGGLMALPMLFRICKALGRLMVLYFYPITTITLEFENEDGSITQNTVKVSNSSELAKSLLKAKKVTSSD